MRLLEYTSFSIITVCYNEQKNIKRTLDSILSQKYSNFEQIICDGGSTDKTNEIIRKYLVLFDKKGIRVKYISKKDGGIYYGMNNGIELANNDYCIFLNGGDCFYNENVLNKINLHLLINKPDVIYGNTINVGKRKSYLNICDHSCLPYGDKLSHQSAFIKTSLLKQRKYDTRYKIASDYDFLLYLYNEKKEFVHIDTIVSNFYLNGTSFDNYKFCFDEAEKIKEFYSIKYGFPIYDKRCLRNKIHIEHDKINKLRGWSVPEINGTWCTDKESIFYVNIIEPKSYCLVINYDIDLFYTIELKVNGKFVSLEKEKYTKKYIAHIPKELLKEGKNEFDIICDKVNSIDEKTIIHDHRKCKLYIKSIDFIYEKYIRRFSFLDILKLHINGHIKKYGWYKRSGLSVWTINTKTIALVHIKVDYRFNYFIKFKIRKNNFNHSKIKFNNHLLGNITNDKDLYCFEIPIKFINDGYNEVTIITEGNCKKDTIIKNKLIRRLRVEKCQIKE